jgi:hypothetical protein
MMHIKLADTWYPEAMLENALIRERESGEMVVIWHFPNGDVNGTDVFTGTDADALRAWLDAHTVGAGLGAPAGIMPQARSGLAAAYNKLVYAMSPAHTVEHEDCQSIPVDGHYEIEYRRGEDNPYVVTSSGDPLDGYKTIEAALDYIHAQAEEAASE